MDIVQSKKSGFTPLSLLEAGDGGAAVRLTRSFHHVHLARIMLSGKRMASGVKGREMSSVSCRCASSSYGRNLNLPLHYPRSKVRVLQVVHEGGGWLRVFQR